MEDLDAVLKSLKNNKSMDPIGMINEVFKAGCIGSDLKEALILLFKGVKANQYLPIYMNLSDITTIYKNKGSRFDLNNDRRILSIVIIMMKLMSKCLIAMWEQEGKEMSRTIC